MISELLSAIFGIVITVIYAYNLSLRKTIILNSKRMKKLNNNIIKVDNRCYRIDESNDKCEAQT